MVVTSFVIKERMGYFPCSDSLAQDGLIAQTPVKSFTPSWSLPKTSVFTIYHPPHTSYMLFKVPKSVLDLP
jgi:hypothetical protein